MSLLQPVNSLKDYQQRSKHMLNEFENLNRIWLRQTNPLLNDQSKLLCIANEIKQAFLSQASHKEPPKNLTYKFKEESVKYMQFLSPIEFSQLKETLITYAFYVDINNTTLMDMVKNFFHIEPSGEIFIPFSSFQLFVNYSLNKEDNENIKSLDTWNFSEKDHTDEIVECVSSEGELTDDLLESIEVIKEQQVLDNTVQKKKRQSRKAKKLNL